MTTTDPPEWAMRLASAVYEDPSTWTENAVERVARAIAAAVDAAVEAEHPRLLSDEAINRASLVARDAWLVNGAWSLVARACILAAIGGGK